MFFQRMTYLTLFALWGAACAGSGALETPPGPAEFPALEARVAADPGDLTSGLLLAAGYREAGRSADARVLIDGLLENAPEDAGLRFMSGVLAEDEGDLAAARTAYVAVLGAGAAGALAEEAARRLEVVRRAEMRAEVAGALAREDEVAQTAPDPATVGVFPFFYEGSDPDWEPLAFAIPEMLATDLAVTGRLQVLDRIRIQVLLDELDLGVSGRVDEGTAARSGRILGSGSIVQGRFRIDAGTRIGVDAAVVAVREPGLERVDPLSAEDAVEQLFALEKQLALDLHEELGVQLTPAERERINERQTESVQALLEFGRGIAAEYTGDYGLAEQHYDNASSIDPNFAMATQRAQRVRVLSGFDAAGEATRFADAARAAMRRQAVALLRDLPAGARARMMDRLSARRRAVLQEVLGQDRLGQTILLQLVFRGPGAGS